MPFHLNEKLRRAHLIYAELLELEKLFGRLVPSHYPWIQPSMRWIKGDGPWQARILNDSFIAMGRMNKNSVGECVLEAKGWTAIELSVQGKSRLAFSVRGDDLILHRFEPGLWENWFGVDSSGDTLPLIPDLFADDKDPRWVRFKASGLSKWPPRLNLAGSDPTAPEA
jgi:hypothetical protein